MRGMRLAESRSSLVSADVFLVETATIAFSTEAPLAAIGAILPMICGRTRRNRFATLPHRHFSTEPRFVRDDELALLVPVLGTMLR
jgi:hypothetical protein